LVTAELKSTFSLLMRPETWLPTVTFTIGFNVPVAVTSFVERALAFFATFLAFSMVMPSETLAVRRNSRPDACGSPWRGPICRRSPQPSRSPRTGSPSRR